MEKLDQLEKSLTRIVFQSIRDAQLYRNSDFLDLVNRSICHIWQIWFTNSPLIPNETSTAKNITSKIEFKNIGNSRPSIKVYGVWSINYLSYFVDPANLT